MKLSKQWLWGVRFRDGVYLHLEGDTITEAAASVGSELAEVKRYIPIKCKVAEDVKAENLQKFLNGRKLEGSDNG